VVKTILLRLINYIEAMKKYSKELKESLIARMLPPGEVSIPDLEKETGISSNTLYCWRIKHRNTTGSAAERRYAANTLSSEDKFSIVVETAGLNEVELSQYCRKRGLYPEQISSWRTSCRQANVKPGIKVNQKEVRNQAKEIKDLKKELHYKEKALAETTALLVLKKKVHILLGEPEDDESTTRKGK
jgi:transposase